MRVMLLLFSILLLASSLRSLFRVIKDVDSEKSEDLMSSRDNLRLLGSFGGFTMFVVLVGLTVINITYYMLTAMIVKGLIVIVLSFLLIVSTIFRGFMFSELIMYGRGIEHNRLRNFFKSTLVIVYSAIFIYYLTNNWALV